MAFENFPYADYHALNLDWLLKKVRQHDTDITKIREEISAANLPQIVKDKLLEMVDDGTLAEIIDQLYEGIGNKVNFMIPTDDERQEYVDGTLKNIVSYMAVNSLSPCVVGAVQNNPSRQIYEYGQGKGYFGIMGVGSFVRNETRTISGVEYSVNYIDCSTWLSLILKDIPWPVSPYALAMQNPTATNDDLFDSARENQSLQVPWTIDWYNNPSTYRNAYIMQMSGCHLRKLARKTPGNPAVIDTNLLNQLETGDLIYQGRQAYYNEGRYKGIYHCAYYVKTLDELNQYGALYNQTYIPYDDGNGAYGYVVHARAHADSTDDHIVLCVETLDHLLNTIPGNDGSTWMDTYTTKPWSNAWNDSKAARRTFLMERDGILTKYNTMTGEDAYGMIYNAKEGLLTVQQPVVTGFGNTARFIETGIEYAADHAVNPNSYADVTLTWPTPRKNIPRLFTQLISSSDDPNVGSLKISVVENTETSATVRLFNPTQNVANMGFYWMIY